MRILIAWLVAGMVTVVLPAPEPDPQRARFLQAEQALEQGQIGHFRQLMSRLGDYPLTPYLWARHYRRHPEPLAEVEDFLRRYHWTRYAGPVRVALLKRLAAAGRWADFLRLYRETGGPALACQQAWALYRQGKAAASWQAARELWLVGRSQPEACNRVFSLWRRKGRIGPELIEQRFRLALVADRPRLAAYLARQLTGERRRRAVFWLRVHRDPARFVCRPWPAPWRRDGEIFVHALKRLARRDLPLALAWWRAAAGKFPLREDQRDEVRRALGLRLAWRHHPEAWTWLAALPDDRSDREVAAWRVRVALRQRHWARVAEALERLPRQMRVRPQWRYWEARMQERRHGQAAAAPLYRTTAQSADFYGFLAADRLGRDYAIDHRPIAPSAEVVAALRYSRAIAAIREFLALGRYWEARREWWYLLRHADHETLLAAARLAREMGWWQMAIFATARAEHWDDLEIRFPLRFLAQVRRYAREQRLDPAYVYGIIRRESAFDERARSGVGARGLMQLMPATARRVARRLDERLRSLRRLERPETNIRYGTAYFRSLLERFGGHFVLATAAYNAGPRRVERWLSDRTLPADIWIETIPFRETRRYVRAVLAYAMIYQKRLEEKNRRLSDYTVPVPPRPQPRPPLQIPDVCPGG